MMLQWSLQAVISTLIIYLISIHCEANGVETDKQTGEFMFTRTAKDEKAFQKVKDHIKEVLRQEEAGKPIYHPNDGIGPRKYYYMKYMKLGKANDDEKETLQESQDRLKNITDNIIMNNEKKHLDMKELLEIANKQKMEAQVNKMDEFSTPKLLPRTIQHINNYYSKEDFSNSSSSFINSSPSDLKQEKNISTPNILQQANGFNKKLKKSNSSFKWINSYLDELKKHSDNCLENCIRDEKSKAPDYKSKRGIHGLINYYQKDNSSLDSLIRTARFIKGLQKKKRKKFYRHDKKTCKYQKREESNLVELKDHRRVRSCDIKMEDLRESFIPNEQLSIYHPKMSMGDQFILQDTMF